jgi:phage host-nuclease inhibitor protein Gam
MEKKHSDDPAVLTVRILQEIRDDARAFRDDLTGQVGTLRTELGALRTELSDRIGRLEKRQSEDATRLATEVVALSKAVGQVRDLLKDRRDERAAISDHEKRIRAIERKIA